MVRPALLPFAVFFTITACSPTIRDNWYRCATTLQCPAQFPLCGSDGFCHQAGWTGEADTGVRDTPSFDTGQRDSSETSVEDARDATSEPSPLDSGVDTGVIDTTVFDGSTDDAEPDASTTVDADDAMTAIDSEADSGVDSGFDSGVDTRVDTGVDTGIDTGVDTGVDAGAPPDATPPTGGVRVIALPSNVDVRSFFVTPGNELVAVGRVSGLAMVGSIAVSATTGTDVLELRANTAGDVIAARAVGAPGNESATSVFLDSVGDVWVAGESDLKSDFGCGGGPALPGITAFLAKFSAGACVTQTHVQAEMLGVPSTAASGDGGAWLGVSVHGWADWGPSSLPPYRADYDIGFARYDAVGTGVIRVRTRGGGMGDQVITDTDPDGAGGYWMAGNFTTTFSLLGASVLTPIGGTDVFALHVNAAGDPQYTYQQGGPGDESAVAIVRRGAGSAWLLGTYSGTADIGAGPLASSRGPRDMYLVGISSGFTAVRTFTGSDYYVDGRALAVDPVTNDVWVTGTFRDRVTLGAYTLGSAGGDDIFVVNYAPSDLTVRRAFRLGGPGNDAPTAIGIVRTELSEMRIWLAGTLGGGDVDFGVTTINSSTTNRFLFLTR